MQRCTTFLNRFHGGCANSPFNLRHTSCDTPIEAHRVIRWARLRRGVQGLVFSRSAQPWAAYSFALICTPQTLDFRVVMYSLRNKTARKLGRNKKTVKRMVLWPSLCILTEFKIHWEMGQHGTRRQQRRVLSFLVPPLPAAFGVCSKQHCFVVQPQALRVSRCSYCAPVFWAVFSVICTHLDT